MRNKRCSITNKRNKTKSRSRSRSTGRTTKQLHVVSPIRTSLLKVEEKFIILTSKVKSLTTDTKRLRTCLDTANDKVKKLRFDLK